MRDPKRYRVLLRVRKQAEDLKAQDLAISRRAVQEARRARTSLELTRQHALEQAGERLLAQFDATELRSYYQYERHLATLRDQKDAEIRALQVVEAEKLQVLAGATLARRVAEKLDERRREAFRDFLAKEDQKQFDETATMYAARELQHRTTHDSK